MQELKDQFIAAGLHELFPYQAYFYQQDDFVQHFIDEGREHEKVIVMLHGNPTWSFYYRSLIKKYSKEFRVIVPDHMGCGLSEKPQLAHKYKLKNHIAHTLNLLNHLKIDKFHLIVHDWGGAIGFGLAQKIPGRVSSIVAMNTAAYTSKHIPNRINFLKQEFWRDFLIRRLNLFAWPASFMASQKKLDSKIRQAYLFPYNSYENRIAISEFVHDIPLKPTHASFSTLANIEKNLNTLKMPKCFIWGIEDFCFDESFLRRFREYFPKDEFHLLKGVGHYVLEDAPKKFIDYVDHFYRRVK
jgi:haloalkane dehalogenase